MRIVHYLTTMDLREGGVVRAVLDLCPALAQRGHDVVLMTLDAKDVPASWTRVHPAASLAPKQPQAAAGNVPSCVVLPGPRGPGGVLRAPAKAQAWEVVHNADVCHIHAMWAPSNDQIARLCALAHVPTIISPHGMLDDWCMRQRALKKRLYLAILGSRSLQNAASVHCTAELELAQASKWFKQSAVQEGKPGKGPRGVVVPLPFDLEDYRELPGPQLAREKLKLTSGEPVVLFLSRLNYKKGIDLLIRAAGASRDQGQPIQLILAGQGGPGDEAYVRSLHELVDALDLRSRVLFPGFVKGKDKVSLYQAADIFCLPSSQENFGYVVVEALASGVPVLTTTGVALWPEIRKRDVGVIIEPKLDELTAALQTMLADLPAQRARAALGREWVLNTFEPQAIISGFVDMYADAVTRKS